MKAIISLLCSGLIVILMLVTPGNFVQAHGNGEGEDCGCPVTYLDGAERNKLVADLIKSSAFKDLKKELQASGTQWLGASQVEAVKSNYDGTILLAALFEDKKGLTTGYVFFNGELVGSAPRAGIQAFLY